MTPILIFIAIYFALLVWLLVWFEVFAYARRNGIDWLKTLAVLAAGWTDILCNYVHFRVLGAWPWSFPGRQGSDLWKSRTVTARIGHLAQTAHRKLGQGVTPGSRELLAYWFALGYLNKRDPDHVKL